MGEPWYTAGLRFSCVRCGACCTGEPGYVWVDMADVDRIAAMLGMSRRQVLGRYVRVVKGHLSLKEKANLDCVFFDRSSRGCVVYAARPAQCRTWPFWYSNIRTPETWQRACAVCPGAGRGRLVPAAEVARQAALVRL